MELKVNLPGQSYPILITPGLLARVGEEIREVCPGPSVAIITDVHVAGYYGEVVRQSLVSVGYRVTQIVLPAGEATKSIDTLPKVYQALVEAGITRQDTIVALGGGVIGDLAGFVAATYLRGITLIQVPTSLLAQVDSSVGGKVAVDLPSGKNLVGAFYHPKKVLIDPDSLKTLPHRYLVDGMGEVIKYGAIMDPVLFSDLVAYGGYERLMPQMTDVILRCCDCKRRVVETDVFDRGDRMKLNFGHTLGHALEQHYHYETYSHGEAVAIGMATIAHWGETRGLTEVGTAERLQQLLAAYELPITCPVPANVLQEAMARDKKKLGSVLHVVLLRHIGESYLYPTTVAALTEELT